MTTIRFDEVLLNEAHDLGLNVTKICENALKVAVKALKSSTIATTEQQTSLDCRNSGAGSSARIEHHPPKVGAI